MSSIQTDPTDPDAPQYDPDLDPDLTDAVHDFHSATSLGVDNWVGIGHSVGVNLSADRSTILGAIWNSDVDPDPEACGLIRDYASENHMTITVDLPDLTSPSPLQPHVPSFEALCLKHDIQFTPTELSDMGLNPDYSPKKPQEPHA